MMHKERSGGLRCMRIVTLAIAPAVALTVVNIPALASGLKSLETASLRLSPDHSLPDPDTEAEFPDGTDALRENQEAAEAASSIQGAPFIQLSKNGGAKLMLGSSDKDCDAKDLLTVRVDGKLMKENIVIDLSDIESSETFPPSEEFPGGLWDIKLKKK